MKKGRQREPSFIEFANSPPVNSSQSSAGGIKYRLTDFAVQLMREKERAKGIPQIDEIHTRLVRFLISIIQKQEIEDSEDLRFFLRAYDSPEFPTYTFEQGEIVKMRQGLVHRTTHAIKSLIEFLASQNIQRIKSCDTCKRFFVARRAPSAKFCSDRCRFLFHKPEKAQWREYIARYRNLEWQADLRGWFKSEGCKPKEIGKLIEQARRLRKNGERPKQIKTYLEANWKKICKHA